MKHITGKIIKRTILLTALGAIVVFGVKPTISKGKVTSENADIRFIFTTDLHGQLNSKDYETGLDYGMGGLARAYDLIMQARNEVENNNSFTFDVGDALYDYTTEHIFSEDQEEIQPILKGMALVGYDAITLGNHEFDYGYNYLLKQLKGSGLMDKVVLSNVFDSKSGENTFKENMIITRSVKTENGKTAEVKIGVIGETIPHLTAKTESYVGILKTEDIVVNVEKQAKKLKEQGADIIVVLSHSGIGEENPELEEKNVSYALTKIEDVDVVLCGHEHRYFPTSDLTSTYLTLPGIDKSTYLVNGKNLVMSSDRGKSIGVVDLEIQIDGDDITIVDRQSNVRFVADYKTTENEEIRSLYGTWESEFTKYSNEIIGELKSGETLQNFAGILEDNASIQILNDSKRSHALRYINTKATQYKDYPIVSVSSYYSYGAKSSTDFVNIKDKFTESDLAILQPYNNYLYLYEISGQQLKEWIEWSASAFETTTEATSWSDKTMQQLINSASLKSLIKEEWSTNWNYFYIFDGVNYTIDISKAGRYDYSGNKISDSSRITSITYNGKPVTSTTKLIIASNKITGPTDANKGVETQYIYKNFYRTQSVLSDYIRTLSKAGKLSINPDNNWSVTTSSTNFIIKLPSIGKTLAKSRPWFVKELKTEDDYTYYQVSTATSSVDKQSPNLYAIPAIIEPTGVGYNIIVDAVDASEIKTIRYMVGSYTINYEDWNLAREVQGNSFKIDTNGTYSVYAEDIHGNRTVTQVVVDNISDKVIATPKVETYTNRKTTIKGTAEANTKIIIVASTGSYETKTMSNGTFSYSLPAQPSGTSVTIYAKDEKTGRISEKVKQTVKRTGPNQPKINYVYNNSSTITGIINDSDAVIVAIVDGSVYVNKGGVEQYKKATDIYDESYTIVETNITIEDNKYAIPIPYLTTGVDIVVYNIDHLNRVSRSNTTVVSENAPNVPFVYQISNIEQVIRGKVTSSRKKINYDVVVEVNGTTYEGITDKNGEFEIPITNQLVSENYILVYAKDTYLEKERISGVRSVKIDDANLLIVAMESELVVNPMNNKDLEISGSYEQGNTPVSIAIETYNNGVRNSEIYEVITDDNGNFEFDLVHTLDVGTKVYAFTRFDDGDIYAINKQDVSLSAPEKPYVLQPINNSQKVVYVVTDKDSTVAVKIGTKTYRTKQYSYDNELNRYIYSVSVGRQPSTTTYKVYAKNATGYSKILTGTLAKVAPNAPIVNAVTVKDEVVTGSVELLGTNVKDTKVYVKIGAKTYKATVSEDGTYTLKIKAQKKNKVITVWSVYNGNRGPLRQIKVTK